MRSCSDAKIDNTNLIEFYQWLCALGYGGEGMDWTSLNKEEPWVFGQVLFYLHPREFDRNMRSTNVSEK